MICSTCKIYKPIDDFSFKNKANGTRQVYCRECKKEYSRQHYSQNKGYYLGRNKDTAIRNSSMVRNLKRLPCTDCGRTFPPCAMQWDHVSNTNKLYNVSKMAKAGVNRIKEEIEKCELICANCHAIRTHKRLGKHGRCEQAPISPDGSNVLKE